MNHSEELDLDGPETSSKCGTTTPSQHDSAINRMNASHMDLSAAVPAGITTEEFVQKLLETPSETYIPWEPCVLPSRGLYYNWGDGTVQVRAMGQVAEKVLATQRLSQSGESIDYLFRECCRFPAGFDPIDLLLGDRIFLLYFLRGITHGNMYEFAVTCPNPECEKVSTHEYDLNILANTITWAKPELGLEPFKVVLPYLSDTFKREVWVGLRFLRAADANTIVAKRKNRTRMTVQPGRLRSSHQNIQQVESKQIDNAITDNLERIIVSIMGVQDRFQIRTFIDKLHAQDTAAIREWLRDNTPGIDSSIVLTCPHCQTESTIELPFSESFFRPAKRKLL